jgi:hypothetical protein
MTIACNIDTPGRLALMAGTGVAIIAADAGFPV